LENWVEFKVRNLEDRLMTSNWAQMDDKFNLETGGVGGQKEQ